MSKKKNLCNSLFCQNEQTYPKALFRNTNTSYNTFNTNLLAIIQKTIFEDIVS